jgi:hypothetical protein
VKSKKVYCANIAFAAAVALALTGCAGIVKKDEDASVLKEKAVQRWDYLIAHQAEKAYDFLSPGYRATITRENYAAGMNNRPVSWQSVKYIDQTCEPDVCTVTVKLTYKVSVNIHGSRNVNGGSEITEQWIRDSGRWYFLPNSNYKAPKAKPDAPEAKP